MIATMEKDNAAQMEDARNDQSQNIQPDHESEDDRMSWQAWMAAIVCAMSDDIRLGTMLTSSRLSTLNFWPISTHS